MTDPELSGWVQRARRRYVHVGGMPALWSLIGDVEALLEGQRSSEERILIERRVREDKDQRGEP